jgi:hypothetical protein
MSEGGLRIHRVGKEFRAGRWEKGISVEPRGLKPGNNIFTIIPKEHVPFMFYPKFLTIRKVMHAEERMQFQG